ncbi:MAG: nuclear transport factor 2 family protein [Chitinophagaceae bacterium]|nr:nuclear transport factor 2 family protein [Chitinophagaceae bacterium]
MKLLIYFLPLALSLTGIAQSSSNDVKTLEKLNEDWIHSYPTKDTATMSRIFADDFLLISPNGSRITKQDALTMTASPDQQIKSAKVDKVQVRLLGNNVALIMAEASFVAVDNGKDVPGRTNYMDVYEKRKGRWVAIAAHVTYLGQ